jgi:hypothetical protein
VAGWPKVGDWYETEEGTVFVVLAADRTSGAVDVQFLGGNVDRFDRDAWQSLDLVEIEPPEGWRGSMDEFFRERGRGK